MKKVIALTAALSLVFSSTLFAAESPSAKAIVAESTKVATVETAAAAANMTVGEYLNNAIVETPGVPDAMPVGQGGSILINGVKTNATVTLGKVTKATAEAALAQAAAVKGKLLNVMSTKVPGANFSVATVNFYLKGLAAGQKVAVYQLVDGAWVALNVVECRADHVVVDMTKSGVIAFVAL